MSDTTNLDLAVIGNCQIAACIDPGGAIVWACLPRLDGDPVFSGLLNPDGDAHRGRFSISMDNAVHVAQRYVRNTAIVETVYEGEDATLRVTDFCPRFRTADETHRPWMIIRIVDPVAGSPVIRVRLRPTGDYGSTSPKVTVSDHAMRFATDNLTYRMTTNASLTAVAEERLFALAGPVAFILSEDEPVYEAPTSYARGMLERTRQYWGEWVRSLAVPVDYQEAVIRAAITLKLCTFEDTGAMLAALTTSIPEGPDSGRNWDYRLCWLRDSYFTVHALNRLGASQTMRAYLRFIHNTHVRTPVGDLQPLYGISGEADLTEVPAPSLRGYRAMGPVRRGNQAFEQKQYDVYGAIILAAAQLFYDQRLEESDTQRIFAGLERLGEHAVEGFAKPDAGPWELRGSERVHTYSAAMCWAGCDRLANIALRVGQERAAARWRGHADTMRARIMAEAWNPRLGSFVSTFGGDTLDATLLLLAELRFVPAMDERFVGTVQAVGRELSVGDLVYRYRYADDFGAPTTTFTVCGFWYANALDAIGRTAEARDIFERLLSRRNSVGLLSEDIDPRTGALWGNFPQAYSMVGIIIGAMRMSRHWEDVV